VENDGRNVTLWWNHNMKVSIKAKKVACNVRLQNKSTLFLITLKRKICNLNNEKCAKVNLGRISETIWIPMTRNPSKFSNEPTSVLATNDLISLDSSKTTMASCSAMRMSVLSNEENISKI